MSTAFLHNFEWDPSKARQNLRKHRVSFERAATVFLDTNQVSVLDEEHDADEERYITLGIDSTGIMLVVVHAFRQTSPSESNIRIISARKATRVEIKQYEGN
jgi:uncharacterized DUF497 family protein